MSEDGVNRDGLDFRAGYAEGLRALVYRLYVAELRCKKSEKAGIELATRIAGEMYQRMLAKMQGAPSESEK